MATYTKRFNVPSGGSASADLLVTPGVLYEMLTSFSCTDANVQVWLELNGVKIIPSNSDGYIVDDNRIVPIHPLITLTENPTKLKVQAVNNDISDHSIAVTVTMVPQYNIGAVDIGS